jgi:hypothetical protein
MKRLAAIFILFAFAVSAVRAATLTAILDRPTMTLGEAATLQLRFEGGEPQALPAMPSIPNLNIQYAGRGSEYQIANGRSSQAVILSYSISASQAGSYAIPPVRAVVNGVTLQSQPVQLVVAKDAAGGESGIAFIKLVVAKTNLYVGELIPIEIKVYGPVIDELQIPNLKSDGFTVGMAAPGVRGGESIGGAMYTVYSFHMTVAPAKAGNIILGPAETTLRVRVQTARRRRADLLDEFFGGGFQSKVLSIASETIPLNVMPLPAENVPPTFNGALGNFQLAVSASPTNVAVGDPISLQIQIKGRGSFDTVKLPDFGWKDFTFYTPNAAFTNADALALSGIKTFDQVVTPQRAGIVEIPPIKFSFFDPEQRVYRTIQRPGIPIAVKATGQGQAQPTVVADQGPQADTQRPATDIVHIKPNPGSLATLAAPVASRPWFLALQVAPLLVWAGACFWRRREDNLARDPRARRQREVAQRIAEGLPQLRAAAAEKRGDTFFATSFRLLQEQLGERLDVPAAAITEAVMDEQLPKLGASADLLKTLREIFQACNQARYAGAAAAGLETMLPKIESSLNDIQKLPHATGGSK